MPRRLSPTILVVGGGFAGRSALRHLIANANNTHIILIDEKPFFEFTPSTLRCIVHPGHIRRITFNQHSDPGIIFLQGRVTCMTDREATVSRREGDRVTAFAVPFDFCVWATGADYAQPIRTTYWGNNPTVLRRRGEFGYFHHKIIASTQYVELRYFFFTLFANVDELTTLHCENSQVFSSLEQVPSASSSPLS